MIPDSPGSNEDAFARIGLDALLITAARSSPDSVVFADDEGGVTASVLARRVRVLAERLRLSGLRPGERTLVVAGARVQTLAAIVASLRAGLEPALAPPGLATLDLAAHARAAGVAALIGPAFYGEACGETYLTCAALADHVRLIATFGAEPVDGALDVSAAALDASSEPQSETAGEMLEMPLIATFTGPPDTPRLVSHRQANLFADALSLVEQASINPSRRIVSLLPPSTRAGLVAGPFAALVGASGLVLHGPFDSRVFLDHLDAEPGAHLVAPAAIAAVLTAETFTSRATSFILVSRFADPEAFSLPDALPASTPIADLYAFGEDIVLAQRRLDGEARPPHRIADRSVGDGLGARLNRARAEQRLQASDGAA